MKDTEILAALRSDGREKGLVRLYRYLPKVESLIRSQGGTKRDAQDVFQEALIVLVQKAQQPTFALTSTIDTYLYGACHLLWRNELRKRGKQPLTDIDDHAHPHLADLEDTWERESRFRQAEAALRQLGKRCQELLVLFYYRSLNMKTIAAQMGFSSENVAKNQKYKCLEQAKLKLKAQTIGSPLNRHV